MSKSPEKCGKNESDGCKESVVNPAKPAYNACVSPIKPIGKARQSAVVAGEENPYPAVLSKIEWESKSDEIMAEEEIRDVIETAKKNPVTNEAIEQAKAFTELNKDEIQKQCMDLVALYNISNAKPFFYITPFEARVAIDYIKKVRNGYTEEINLQGLKDAFVHKFIGSIKEFVKIPNLAKIDSRYDTFECFSESFPVAGKLSEAMSVDVRSVLGSDVIDFKMYNPVTKTIEESEEDKAVVLKPYYVYNLNSSDESISLDGGITLNFINKMFTRLEMHDLMVDIMIMNARRISDIRDYGKTVYNEYTISETKKRKCFGRLFSAEMYPCNKLSDNQVIFGSLIEENGEYKHGVFLNVMF
jgi:hypothetical protein